MAHQIPEYLKYVTSITIENGGSGYSSVTPPVITISGGGGTGATATASVFDGEITDVNITNVGEGYSSEPTVTVTDSGGAGAVLTANVAFATVPSVDYDEKIAPSVKYTVPEFIREDYNQFITFIEKYYEYMDSDGNPINLLLNKDYSDIDELDDAELNKRAEELAKDFPQLLESDRRDTLKRIKSIYESKGSERSIKAYFKLLYNEEVEVYYPSKNILRASDGIWIQEKSLRVTPGYNNYDVTDIDATLADIRYHETVGSVPFIRSIPVTISRVSKISYTSPQIYEVGVELPSNITEIPGPGTQAAATLTIVSGEITDVTITNEGYDYTAAPSVVITDSSGSGFEGRAVVSEGKLTSVVISDGGSGYTSGATISFDTSDLRTYIVSRGATNEEENKLAYLDRTLSSVATGTYSGSNAGFSIGEIFVINQGGGVTNNNAIIRIQSVDNKNVPTSWTIINPGRQFTKSQFNVTIGSILRETVQLTFTTSFLFTEEGKYKDDRGKLSNVNRIQDNYRYQSYSYIIKSTIPETSWKKRFKEIMHPAGMEVFGDLIIANNVGFSEFFSITTDGLHLHEFKTEDVVTFPDTITIQVDYFRFFTETVTTSEQVSLGTQKAISNTASPSDEYADDIYVEEDYLPFAYHGPGVFKLVNKVLETQATATESFDREISFVRSFVESSSVSEVFIASYEKPFTETILVSEVFDYLYSFGLPVSDTVGLSDEYDFPLYVENGYLPEMYHGPGVFKSIGKEVTNIVTASSNIVINTSKTFTETQNIVEEITKNISAPKTETITTSDSGVASIQDYAPTYFSEDYVGDSYII